MKIALGIVGALVVVVLGILGVASMRPDDFHYARSVVIHAPAEKIFPNIADFKGWAAWSPYDKMDPGNVAGKGAIYEWSGNDQVGTGRMEFMEVTPPNKLVIDLQFIKPFEARNVAEFTLTPKDGGTEVTWAMTGKNPLMSKVFGMLMDMEGMVTKDFVTGLESLKAIAEKS